jgi:hypothetical protein
MLGSERMDELSLASFRSMIRRRSALNDKEPIPSTSAAQAAIVMETSFARAQQSVKILSGGLNARTYGSPGVIVEAKKFLANRRSKLEIVFLEPQEDDFFRTRPLLSSFSNNRNVDLYFAGQERREKIRFHFSVVDQDSYGFKTDIGRHESITAFGDVDFAITLARTFDRVARLSEPVLQAA